MKLPPSSLTESNDNLSDAGSDFGSRRRNLKFRTLGSTDGHGKPLGDREIMLKKKKEQNGGTSVNQPDQAEQTQQAANAQDDMGRNFCYNTMKYIFDRAIN